MGDRSNINFITEYRDNGEVVGLNAYFHYQGPMAHMRALMAADIAVDNEREAGRSLRIDPYFISNVASAAAGWGDGMPALTPFVEPDRVTACARVLDNQHLVLTFDLVRQLIVVADDVIEPSGDSWGHQPSIVYEFPLDEDGIELAGEALVIECDPRAGCPVCEDRARFEALGMTRVDAEFAALNAAHDRTIQECDEAMRQMADQARTKDRRSGRKPRRRSTAGAGKRK